MTGIISQNLNRSSGLIKESAGGISWDTTAKTSNFTSEVGKGYFINTTSAAITATLPASAEAGDIVAFVDYTGTFATNNLTIGRNSHKIQGVANDSVISTIRASVVLVYVDSTKGWLYSVESNVADLNSATYVAATGGTITTSGDFKVHTFNSSGTFEVTAVGNSCGSSTVDYLVVAGGGGGASGPSGAVGGGGGAGGFRTSYPNPATGGFPVAAQEYPITVGAGGSQSGAGANSVFSSITSAGGGPGGFGRPDSSGNDGVAGGSGGGGGTSSENPASGKNGSGGAGNTPPVSPSQGNAGGAGFSFQGHSFGAGAGGGAAAAGACGGGSTGGAGGAGTPSTINGSDVTRAGGGGGGASQPILPAGSETEGAGGAGGGGTGENRPNNPDHPTKSGGTDNTGGGGGGGNIGGNGAGGGSGVVIIRYKFQN